MVNRSMQSRSLATAGRIGRLVESNLSNWALGTIGEVRRADALGADTAPLLSMGLWLLRARQDVWAGLREVERQRWEARR